MASGFNTRGMSGGRDYQRMADESNLRHSMEERIGYKQGGGSAWNDRFLDNYTSSQIAQREQQQRRYEEDKSKRDRVSNARQEMYGIANQRLDETRNDPIDKMIIDLLTERSTTDVPYDEKTIDQLMTQGSESAAGQFANEQRSLDNMAGRSGVNKSDPAYIAMQREAKERQNTSNTRTRRKVQTDARVENYNAQGRGLQDLGRANTGQQNRIDRRSDKLVNMHGRESAEVEGAPVQAPERIQPAVNFSSWQGLPRRSMFGRRLQ